jgi:hypothetical protein
VVLDVFKRRILRQHFQNLLNLLFCRIHRRHILPSTQRCVGGADLDCGGIRHRSLTRRREAADTAQLTSTAA